MAEFSIRCESTSAESTKRLNVASEAPIAGEFLLAYRGELVHPTLSDQVEDQTHIYYFQCGSKQYRFVRGNVNLLPIALLTRFDVAYFFTTPSFDCLIGV